jgi:hypothetical protein
VTEVLAGLLLVSGLTTEVFKFAQGMQVRTHGCSCLHTWLFLSAHMAVPVSTHGCSCHTLSLDPARPSCMQPVRAAL